jgi:response regulator NasT
MSAMSLARECLPDIAILDTAIPHNVGLSAVREIRQKQKIPVILLMSSCDPDTLNRAKTIGITTILTKPFREQDLLPAIELAFARAREVEFLNEQVEYLEKIIEDQNFIYKAKKVLLRSEGLSESEAFRKIQKLAMDKQKSMRQIADDILNSEQRQNTAAETYLLPEHILISS